MKIHKSIKQTTVVLVVAHKKRPHLLQTGMVLELEGRRCFCKNLELIIAVSRQSGNKRTDDLASIAELNAEAGKEKGLHLISDDAIGACSFPKYLYYLRVVVPGLAACVCEFK